MKLIALIITPHGSVEGYKAQAVIDHNSTEWKAMYVEVVQQLDDSFHITSRPHNISEEDLNEAYAFAKRMINQTLAVAA